MVTIKIPSGIKFQAPAHLLAHHSKYFRDTLNDTESDEATTLHFELSEHAGDEAVDLFVAWIYHRSLHEYDWKTIHSYVQGLDACETGTTYPPDVLIEAWSLGDSIEAIAFKNDMLRALHEEVTESIFSSHPFLSIPTSLAALDAESPAYRMLVAILGRELYAKKRMIDVEENLDEIECVPFAYAAVTKYMALYGATIATDITSSVTTLGASRSERAKVLDIQVRTIRDGGRGVSVEDFLEVDGEDEDDEE